MHFLITKSQGTSLNNIEVPPVVVWFLIYPTNIVTSTMRTFAWAPTEELHL